MIDYTLRLSKSAFVLPRLRVLSVDSRWCTCQDEERLLRRIVEWVVPVAEARASFVGFLIGCVSFSEEAGTGRWFVETLNPRERVTLSSDGMAVDFEKDPVDHVG